MTDKEKALAYLSTMEGFAERVLKFNLHEKQKLIVNEFEDLHGRTKVAVSAPNGAGKSSKINAAIILRTICTKPQSRVIITSADARQLDAQVWPAVSKYRHLMPEDRGWKWQNHDKKITSPMGGFVYMFTTREPGRAEGWHYDFDKLNDTDAPCIIIIDEAKSVEDEIHDTIDKRCTYNGLLLISSTGPMVGSFYNAMCGRNGFKRYALGLSDCPHIPQSRIDALLEDYKDNLNHPLLRSTLYGEFMDVAGDFGRFCTLTDIQDCMRDAPEPLRGDVVAFCDFAGGGAENVLAVRRGNKVDLVRCWREPNEMVAIGQFIILFRENHLTASQIWGDNCGAGKPMIARFHEVGWPINRFSAGDDALRPSDYQNRGAEVWEMGGRDIKSRKVIIPNDPKLHDQLIARRRLATSDGRIKAEEKEKLHMSIDRADAVMSCIAIRPLSTFSGIDTINWRQHLSDQAQDEMYRNILPGADIGNQ